jgi:DNA helicase HerA-like ATPase
VILLGRLPEDYRVAVVAVITRMLMNARGETAFIEKRLALDPEMSPEAHSDMQQLASAGIPKTVVVLDEAQAFLAPDKSSLARDLFIQLVKEGRNVGLSAVLATQQPSALERRVLSQVETFLSHQLVTEPDLRAVNENLKSRLPESVNYGTTALEASDLLRQLPPGYCVVSSADMNTSLRRSLIMRVRPRGTVHGGIEL